MRKSKSPFSPKTVLGLIGVSLLAGAATGCSSDVLRLKDGYYTGADQLTTSSVRPQPSTPTPPDYVGGGRLPSAPETAQQTQPVASQYPSSGGTPMAQPFPATVPNNDSSGSRAGLYTGSVASTRGGIQSSALPEPTARHQTSVGHARSGGAPAPRPEPSLNQQAAMLSKQTDGLVHRDAQKVTAKGSASSASYVVQSGDTLTRIASRTGVSIDALKQVNGLSGSAIRVGQRLTLPRGTSAPTKSAPTKTVTTASIPSPGKQTSQKSEPKQKTASAEPQPKSYTPPTRSEESVSNVEAGTKVAVATPESSGIGKLRWPLHGQVVAKFGSESDGHRNDGIDISVPEGSRVKAAENGVVIYAGNGLKEYGNTILIRHDDGLVTVYGYAKDLKVSRGDKVTRGEVIADSGMSGAAKRPTLHFEVRKDAKPVNPMTYLD